MSALRVPAFRRLALAWTCSNFGDSVLYLTLGVWVKDLTGSDAAAGLVFLFLGLPVLLAPLAGQLADRGSRRRLVMLANLVGAAGVLSLGLVRGEQQVWLVYLVTFGYGLITYVTSAAGSGLVRDLLDDDDLASGNGLLSTIDQGLRLVSPLVGVGVYALFGGFAVAGVTSIMLVLAAVVTSTVRMEESPPASERESFRREVTAGARHIRSVPVLARVTMSMAVAFAVTGLANPAIFAVIDDGLHRSSDFFGVIAAVQGAGSIVGGVMAAALIRRTGERASIAIGLVVLGAGFATAAVPSVAVVCAGSAVVGLSVPWIVVAFSTMRQKATPAHLQGRVQAATNMALNAPQTVGTAVGAALVAIVDYQVLMIGMAVVIAASAAPVATFSRDRAPSATPTRPDPAERSATG